MQQKQLTAKKGLGQNFLHNPAIIHKIVDSLNLREEDVVLEIGCGTGALTSQLAGKTRFYVGVEIDTALCDNLVKSFLGGTICFLNKDILKLDLTSLRQELSLFPAKFKIVGNLPYYISSPILEHLSQNTEVIEYAVIMLQAEVADRLLAEPGTKEYGVLTLLTQYYFKIRELFAVNPRAFWPVPKVDSKVVRLVPQPARPLRREEEEAFFALVKRAFSQRRKTLANCLKGYPQLGSEQLASWLQSQNYPLDLRGERLSLDDFVGLFRVLSIHRP
jgi:16S rRNA (adenine1518-N6/adenine1519-N6)-dimethyltransferase